jgi:hypothetical protein
VRRSSLENAYQTRIPVRLSARGRRIVPVFPGRAERVEAGRQKLDAAQRIVVDAHGEMQRRGDVFERMKASDAETPPCEKGQGERVDERLVEPAN